MLPGEPILIKKYGNRRLYDTDESRYITLDELATKVEEGASVRVIDAKSKADLTAATLTQIITEGRELSRLLPVELLEKLIRLGDDALAEFFGKWVVSSLEVYLQAKKGIRGAAAWNPLAAVPFSPQEALARLWMSMPFAGSPEQPPPEPPPEEPPPKSPAATSAEVAALRNEIEELKNAVRESTKSGRKKKS